MFDAARGASAARTTVVMPHYAYARSDKKDAPRISIGGRLVADLLVTSGANRVLAMTLHSPQVHGFFSVPVDHLHALRELADHFRRYDLSRTPSWSRPTWATPRRRRPSPGCSGVPVAAGAKQRFADDRVTISAVIGEIAGPRRHRAGRRDRQGQHRDRTAGPAAGAGRRVRSGSPAPTGCSPPVRSSGSATSPTCSRSSAPTPYRSRPGTRSRQAAGAVDRPGPGRGRPPDPQRRVGQRPVSGPARLRALPPGTGRTLPAGRGEGRVRRKGFRYVRGIFVTAR